MKICSPSACSSSSSVFCSASLACVLGGVFGTRLRFSAELVLQAHSYTTSAQIFIFLHLFPIFSLLFDSPELFKLGRNEFPQNVRNYSCYPRVQFEFSIFWVSNRSFNNEKCFRTSMQVTFNYNPLKKIHSSNNAESYLVKSAAKKSLIFYSPDQCV